MTPWQSRLHCVAAVCSTLHLEQAVCGCPAIVQMGRLTKGLWLVWEYEGDKTLAYYLKRR